MPAPRDTAKRDTILSLKRAGLTISAIFRETGIARDTIRRAFLEDGGVPDRPTNPVDQFTVYESIHGIAKPRVRVKAWNRYGGQVSEQEGQALGNGPIVRVVVVADTHDNPALPQHRFEHIGKFVAENAPDFLVHAGDWADFEFASRFEEWSSIHGRERSPFRDEMDSLLSAIERLQTPLAHMSKPPRLITTLGNHDERVWLWENSHPECEGMMWRELESALADWEVYPYRQFAFIEGVGFTHAPHNAAGRPYMGKTPENQIANDASFSVVSGHTHKSVYRTAPKLGAQNQVTIFNPGCALPYGYIKPYAALSMTGWSWGIGTLSIQDGRIISHSLISMAELEARYGR